ncbi:hypothetical protein V6N11_052264 [Hibiscus sabdariffa]|uniref:Uncharacterized protein n=1 Tax=Hibiscus sabdariffa TaxID=183260 RepID=A0ABR2U9L7_9ROSI
MPASPQQMVNSGFNVSVPTQRTLMSHAGPVHQMSPVYATSQAGSSHASSSHMNSPTAAPATYVTTSSQWPAANDGACGCVVKSSQSQNVLLRAKLTPEGLYKLSSPTHNNGSSSSSLHSDRGDFSPTQLNSQSFSSSGLPSTFIVSQSLDELGNDAECHPADHMQDRTMQDSGNEPSPVHSGNEPSPVHSGNGIHEELFPEDAQVTDEIVTEVLQGDNAVVLNGFQTDDAMEPDDVMEPDGAAVSYGNISVVFFSYIFLFIRLLFSSKLVL